MTINSQSMDAGHTKTKTESGYYGDAVRCMRERDDHHSRLLAALEVGERDIAAGRTVPYTQDLLKEVEQEARAHAANNRPANPDVSS